MRDMRRPVRVRNLWAAVAVGARGGPEELLHQGARACGSVEPKAKVPKQATRQRPAVVWFLEAVRKSGPGGCEWAEAGRRQCISFLHFLFGQVSTQGRGGASAFPWHEGKDGV
jgi:hypothetical protein